MSRIGRYLCGLMCNLFLLVGMFAPQAIADPVIVAQTGANSDLSNPRQIVRTSTGRIYYLGGNAGRTTSWDGWLEVHASGDGSSWNKESTRDQWYLSSDIGVSIDSKNILHVISYDWNHHPYYVRYNTADSSTASLAWDGYELLEATKTSDIGKCAMAVDANGKPHVVYQSLESSKGKTYYTLTYANRVGTAWSKVAIWPITLKTSFSGKIDIAIGRDNIPYILIGNKILKGNTNAATSFETKDLGSAGTSVVIQQNGDIKVAQISNGKYAINSHDFTSPWSSGWSLAESTTPDSGSTLLLANDTLYAARLNSDGIWLQKNLDPPFLAAAQPVNTTWQSLTARWSSYNHSKQGVIDLGTRSWNQQNGNLIWYSASLAGSRANFYGGPFSGVAPLKVSLFDSSIPREGSDITSWRWDFDNDGTADVSGPNATYIYTAPGKYSVSLAITDSSGGQDKIVMPNLVTVDGDSDGDGISDSLDNCPNNYNPLQIDLNGNGIGDVCEPVFNRIATATYMTGLRSFTSADSRKSSDVTGIMTDGLLNASSTLTPATYDAISFTINKEARGIKQLILEYYATGVGGYPNYSYANIMPYNSDFSTTVNVGMSGRVYYGWNVVDLTPIIHRMDGFGKVKFRLAPSYAGFNISELKITEKVDAKELVVSPTALDFGAVEIPKKSVQNIVVQNMGTETMNITRVHAPSAPFSVDAENCSGKQLVNNASCSISVAFASGYNIAYQDVLIIDSDDAEQSSKRITLTGSGTLALSGVVKDAASGQPLGNVTVTVTDTVRTQTVTTDSNGVYLLPGVSVGACSVTFTRADYKTNIIQSVIKPSQANPLDVQLAFDYASISGSITDQATGLPLSGVKVTLELSGISSKDPADRQYLLYGSAQELTATEYALMENNDSQKTRGGGMLFRVRNPYGKDPFTVRWNGIAALNEYSNEYLAQSYTAKKTGMLTKVGFYLNSGVSQYVSGDVRVLLKSALGGDRGTYLAKSNPVNFDIVRTNGPGWIYFDFPTPFSVIAGQEYYLEINGFYFEWIGGGGYLYKLNWSNSSVTTEGAGYRRNGGLWNTTSPFACQTLIAGVADMNIAPADTINTSMYGANDASMYVSVVQNDGTSAYNVPTNIDSTDDGQGYLGKYNGDDLTALGTVNKTPELYYDPNGWIEVVAMANSNWDASLVTDQFSLTFNRTMTTTTDVNGAYSFSNLLSGTYIVTMDRAAYIAATAGGTLITGQAVSLSTPITKAQAATLQGTIQLMGGSSSTGAGVTVTLTDPVGTHTTISDGNGNYRIEGIVYGAYGVTFSSPYLQSVTQTGILASGQTASLNVLLTVLRPVVLVSAPLSGAVISSSQFVVTGTAANTETVKVTVTNNGVEAAYQGSASDGTFSIPVDTKLGQNYIVIHADNPWVSLNITTIIANAPFITRNLGDIGNVTVMEVTGNYDAKNPDGTYNDQPRQAIAKEYFKTHSDLDFLVYLSTFDYAMTEAAAKGFFTTVKNDTQGINKPIYDNTATFGSVGMLQGTIDMGNVSQLADSPYGTKLDENLDKLSHEMMHRFGAYVRFKNPDGTLNTSLLSADKFHWSYLLDTQGSLMYGNGWKNNGDGTFTSTSARSGFSSLDLYLMGMIDKSQVPPMLLIDNPAIDKSKQPHQGDVITGTARTVTIDDIIAAEGPRIPDTTTAQKQFKIGYVLLTRAGVNPGNAPQAIEVLRKAFPGKLLELTQGKGSIGGILPSLEILIGTPSDNTTVTGPDVTVSGAVLNTTGAETGVTVNGIVATVNGSRFIANHVPLQLGSNTFTITATDANGLTATTTRTVTAQQGHYIRIRSNIESGTAPLEASLRIESSFVVNYPPITTSGTATMEWLPWTSQTEFGVRISSEGMLAITVSAVGPDGQTYSDTVTITAVNRAKLEGLLKGKWEGMKTAIIGGNVDAALTYFVSAIQDRYRGIFFDPTRNIAARLSEINRIEVASVEGVAAQAVAIRLESSGEHAYPLNFVRDVDGVWKILGF